MEHSYENRGRRPRQVPCPDRPATAEKTTSSSSTKTLTSIEDIVNIYDVRGLAGNGGCYDVQKGRRWRRCRPGLIATTSSDEINISACLVAKSWARFFIRNPE